MTILVAPAPGQDLTVGGADSVTVDAPETDNAVSDPDGLQALITDRDTTGVEQLIEVKAAPNLPRVLCA